MAVEKGRTSLASETPALKVGDPAPDFTLKSHAGEEFTLSAQRGKNVIVAFYPFAFTGTCSTQIPTYERELDRFRERGAQVVGISVDSPFANAAWAQQLGGINYPLLSDFYPHGAVAKAYGVLRESGNSERALFVIDKDGIVRYIDVHELREAPDETVLFEELDKLQS